MCFAHYYHPPTILVPHPQLKILYETLDSARLKSNIILLRISIVLLCSKQCSTVVPLRAELICAAKIHEYLTGFLLVGGGGHLPPLGYTENPILHVNQALMTR